MYLCYCEDHRIWRVFGKYQEKMSSSIVSRPPKIVLLFMQILIFPSNQPTRNENKSFPQTTALDIGASLVINARSNHRHTICLALCLSFQKVKMKSEFSIHTRTRRLNSCKYMISRLYAGTFS